MCIIFAACFILRGRDMHIDFLQFVSGQRDLPSDAIAFSLISFEMETSFLRLNKLLGCLIFCKVPPGSNI